MGTLILPPDKRQQLLLRATGLSQQEIADKTGLTFNNVGDLNKEIHALLKANSGIMALGVAVSLGEITPQELFFMYVSMHHPLNKYP